MAESLGEAGNATRGGRKKMLLKWVDKEKRS
jgi:hypothetical protein